MEWLGDKPGLKYSVVARLSYAAAVGPLGLEPNLRRFERFASELEIHNIKSVIKLWKREGATVVSACAAPRTS